MSKTGILDLSTEDLTEAAWDELTGARLEDDPDFTECDSCNCACSCCGGFNCNTSIIP